MGELIVYSVKEILEAHDEASKPDAPFETKKAMLDYFNKKKCKIALITNDEITHAHCIDNMRASRLALLNGIKNAWATYFNQVLKDDP